MFTIIAGLFLAYLIVFKVLGITNIGSDEVAIVEKWWSTKGNLEQGKLISLNGEAGFQPDLLRAGIHVLPRFMFRVHKYPMIVIPQGQIGYIFARDGISMDKTQLLGKDVDCQNFQNARMFLKNGGQKGPQRAILREGAYAINLAQFIVITKDKVFSLENNEVDKPAIESMKQNILSRSGFEPVVIKEEKYTTTDKYTGEKIVRSLDLMGIVTVHEGKALENDDIIAPTVGTDIDDKETYHNCFQAPEAFLKAGGYKGKQEQVISDGTYYINRLFATVEIVQKTVVPMGYTAVVNSFVGEEGEDVSGSDYKHGELVEKGCKGIWAKPLQPGKYALNTQAMTISLVPTTNIILKWERGTQGDHNFDSNLKEVTLITKDAFEPTLPLSVVIHIDYNKAPYVIQRFGDIKMLVEQSLDPLISAYFKNTAQKLTLIELLQQRAELQTTATEEMRKRFEEYNLNLVEVLIGTPNANGDEKIEQILSQLSERQFAQEQLVTFESKMRASEKERELREFQAKTAQQAELTKSSIDIEIQQNLGKAELQKAEQDAIKTQKLADAKAYEAEKLAEAEAKKQKHLADAQAYEREQLAKADAETQKQLADADAYEKEKLADVEAKAQMKTAQAEAFSIRAKAEAESESIEKIGLAQAKSVEEQVKAYGGATYILQREAIQKMSDAVKDGKIPLVPQNVVSLGGSNETNSIDAFKGLVSMMIAEKVGVDFKKNENTENQNN